MAPALLWVHKSSGSSALSHSAKPEAANIRRHVQTTRRVKREVVGTLQTEVRGSDRSDGTKSISSQAVLLTSSLRPNRSFGRITKSKAAASQHKYDAPTNCDKTTLCQISGPVESNTLALSTNITWMWQGFNPAERSSLAFFELRTLQDWAGWQDIPFWASLVLPLSHKSRAIACGLIALAALHESIEAQDACYKNRLRCLSLYQAEKTVQELAASDLSYFEALISCVIVLCFQNIQGSRTSFRLLRSGLRMLEQRRGHITPDEEDMVQQYLLPVLGLLRCRPCRMGDLSAAIRLSIRKQQIRSLDSDLPGIPSIPPRIMTVPEARIYLQSMLSWAHDSMAYHFSHGSSAMEAILSLRQLRRRWEIATASIPTRPPGAEKRSSSRSIHLLRAACIIGVILLETAETKDEMVYDAYFHDFRKIIELVEQVAPNGSPHSKEISFGIDSGLVDIVKFVGIKCRDPCLRRRALQLLVRGGRVEGDRIASIPGDILQTHIDLEEEGLTVLTSGDVPEVNRWRLLHGRQHFYERKIELTFVASPYEPGTDAVIEKRYISLPGPCEVTASVLDDTSIPDAIFGPGYAQYLDDRASQQYFKLELDRFHFPIPKA